MTSIKSLYPPSEREKIQKELKEKTKHLEDLDKLKFDASEVKAIALKEKLRQDCIDLAKRLKNL